MQIFTKKTQVIDLVETNYHLLPVLNRFGISLGNREMSLGEICASVNVDVHFLLAIINTYHNEDYFPEKELQAFSPKLILDYLQKTHAYYLEYVLPKIEQLLDQLMKSDTSGKHQLELIEKFYLKYKKELLLHIQEEEEVVFPYITSLLIEGLGNAAYTIHTYEKEHSNIDIKLHDLKNLVIKYIEPVYDNNICNEFLITLLRFERDLVDHARIEDKILIPQVLQLEREIHG
jgi:regulator of cell morphogenesis and NO signaling